MASEERKAGRPRLNATRRVRFTTTIEPRTLAILRCHAEGLHMSIGQLADVLVREYIAKKSGEVIPGDIR